MPHLDPGINAGLVKVVEAGKNPHLIPILQVAHTDVARRRLPTPRGSTHGTPELTGGESVDLGLSKARLLVYLSKHFP